MASNTAQQQSTEAARRDGARSIRNSRTSFSEHERGRLTQTRLQNPSRRSRRSRGNRHGEESAMPDMSPNYPATGRAQEDVREIFEAAGEKFEPADMQEISNMREEDVPKPGFPFFILPIAILKDIIDAIVTATLVGIVVSMALSFLFSIILFIWTLSKLRGTGRAQKKIANRILMKYGFATGIEFIPGINVIPTTTIFVLVAYFDEARAGKLYQSAHKKIYPHGVHK